jgi:hypothetical protein
MQQVRVWNDNDYAFTDPDFKGEKITIPAKKYILMERFEANEFRGKYSPRVVADGNEDPRYYKKIRIEETTEEREASLADTHNCLACGKSHPTKEALDAHIDEAHLAQLEDQDLAQKRKAKKKE